MQLHLRMLSTNVLIFCWASLACQMAEVGYAYGMNHQDWYQHCECSCISWRAMVFVHTLQRNTNSRGLSIMAVNALHTAFLVLFRCHTHARCRRLVASCALIVLVYYCLASLHRNLYHWGLTLAKPPSIGTAGFAEAFPVLPHVSVLVQTWCLKRTKGPKKPPGPPMDTQCPGARQGVGGMFWCVFSILSRECWRQKTLLSNWMS